MYYSFRKIRPYLILAISFIAFLVSNPFSSFAQHVPLDTLLTADDGVTSPNDAALVADNLWVASTGSDEVYVVEIATNTLITTIAMDNPYSLAASPVTGNVYVICNITGPGNTTELRIYDPVTYQPLDTIMGNYIRSSARIKFAENGEFYLSDRYYNQVNRFASDGTWLSASVDDFAMPSGVAVHPTSGEVCAADVFNNQIRVFTADLSTELSSFACGESPAGIAFRGDGYIFVTITAGGPRIEVYLDGVLVETIITQNPRSAVSLNASDVVIVNYNGDIQSWQDPSTLPVELMSFTARLSPQNSTDVVLLWQTASEINNEGFEVQWSHDGRDWQKIGWVEGMGDAANINDYSFTHLSPLRGLNYYRLKQMDFDGRYEYSFVTTVSITNQSRVHFYPNPATSELHLELEIDDAVINIYSLSGELVKTLILESNRSVVDISELKPSTYILEIKDRNEVVIERFIKGRWRK